MIDVGMLKNKSNLERYPSGQIIIEDGETMCDEMYILLKGTADIYKSYQEPGEIKIASLKPGDFFGEMSLFLNKERTATVVATEDVVTLAINRMNAYDFFEKQPEATYSLIKTLCSRLDSSNAAYKKLYNETHPEIPQTGETCASSLAWLFPAGHKDYRRTVNMAKVSSLFEKDYTCPACGTAFTASTETLSWMEPTYKCMRPAKGMNDFYYEVITCPICWYSAFARIFGHPDKKSELLFEPYTISLKSEITAILGDKTGITGIFARYSFALKCATKFFNRSEEIMARLWIRISWLYYDCKEEQLEVYAVKQAQEAYIAAVEKREVPKDQLGWGYYAIGELSLKVNELYDAKKFFYLAEDCSKSPEMKQQIGERIEDVQQRLNELVSMLRQREKTDSDERSL